MTYGQPVIIGAKPKPVVEEKPEEPEKESEAEEEIEEPEPERGIPQEILDKVFAEIEEIEQKSKLTEKTLAEAQELKLQSEELKTQAAQIKTQAEDLKIKSEKQAQEMLRQNFFNRHDDDFNDVVFRLDEIFRRQLFCVAKSFLRLLVRLFDNRVQFVLNFFFAVFNAFLFAVIVARVVTFLLNFFEQLFGLLFRVLDDFFCFGRRLVQNFLSLLFGLNF